MTLRLLWNFVRWCPYQVWLLIKKFILFIVAKDRGMVTDDAADTLPIFVIFWLLTFFFGMILAAFVCGTFLDSKSFLPTMGAVLLSYFVLMGLHIVSIIVRVAFAAFLKDQQKYFNALKDGHK